MKLKPILFALIALALTWSLNRGWNFGKPVPPMGKFLDPFHGFWQNGEAGQYPDEVLNLPGIQGQVTIAYDSIRIPHIYAAHDEDLYFAQGYVHARDRLWQMEFQTHAGAGRLSEILGPGQGDAVLDYDRTQRRQGMVFAARRALDMMQADPQTRMVVEQYTRGVNQYIADLKSNDLPFEYKLLDYQPEPWTPLKSAILLKNMARTLNTGEKDLAMTNTLKLFGKATVDLLFPDREHVGDPIVDRTGKWNFNAVTLDTLALAVPPELITSRPLEDFPTDVGSNNWAVAGTRTVTGSPMLSSDPHLGLSLPSIWYAIHLKSPTVNTMGVSLPGSPAVIIGFNDSIAWGLTNAQRDLVDWYAVKFKDRSKSAYWLDGQWEPTRKEVEAFLIKGRPVFYDTIVYTHQGPVVFDESFHADHEQVHYAYRWISHDPSNELKTFLGFNRGRNHADYMAALDHFTGPAQNFAFASVSGDIAMRIQGKYPVRRVNEGKFILDGTTRASDWHAFIPNEHNIQDKNPARGFVSSANQYPADSTYPYYIQGHSFEAYRNRRINQRLNEMHGITPADLMALQNDTYNLKAAESLPFFLSALDPKTLTPEEREAYETLQQWNYQNDVASMGASWYEAWWDALHARAWDELQDEKHVLRKPTTYQTLYLLRTQPGLSFWDIQGTPEKETAKELLQVTFKEGVKALLDWQQQTGTAADWATFKDTYVGHLARLEPLSAHVRHGGNHDIVNASSHSHGPSWRMVVSLEKTGVQAWAVYPGGQSGNPGSPHYQSMLNHWATGKYFRLSLAASPTDLPILSQRITIKPKP